MDDTITHYSLTVAHNVKRFCPGCSQARAVWRGTTAGGDTLTCCGTCQRVLERRPALEHVEDRGDDSLRIMNDAGH